MIIRKLNQAMDVLRRLRDVNIQLKSDLELSQAVKNVIVADAAINTDDWPVEIQKGIVNGEFSSVEQDRANEISKNEEMKVNTYLTAVYITID